ncbi:MAG: outer membrane lipoprotein LolB [Proteobacteria bacterium]|nr:outer membrane lipoprotein LolB [Pseudomonadota bacterium]
MWACVLAGALTLGGCATPAARGRTAQAVPAAQDIRGRISVVTGTPPAQHNIYGGFRLELFPGGDGEFDVYSPLGQMLAQAQWSTRSARLDDGKQTRSFTSFEDMTFAALGLALPRAALQDWVRGMPAADLPFETLGHGAFEQVGWRVQPRLRDGQLYLLRASRVQGPPAELSLVVDRARPEVAASAPAASASPAVTASAVSAP